MILFGTFIGWFSMTLLLGALGVVIYVLMMMSGDPAPKASKPKASKPKVRIDKLLDHTEHFLDDLLHRIGGPAVIWDDGTRAWWKHGKRHRENGPAVIMSDGTVQYWWDDKQLTPEEFFTDDRLDVTRCGERKEYRWNGYFHRFNGPARTTSSGELYWYQWNRLHRTDGPAAVMSNGTKKWFLHGRLHRIDGPAIEWADGTRDYYLDAVKYTPDDFITKLNCIQKATTELSSSSASADSEVSESEPQDKETTASSVQMGLDHLKEKQSEVPSPLVLKTQKEIEADAEHRSTESTIVAEQEILTTRGDAVFYTEYYTRSHFDFKRSSPDVANAVQIHMQKKGKQKSTVLFEVDLTNHSLEGTEFNAGEQFNCMTARDFENLTELLIRGRIGVSGFYEALIECDCRTPAEFRTCDWEITYYNIDEQEVGIRDPEAYMVKICMVDRFDKEATGKTEFGTIVWIRKDNGHCWDAMEVEEIALQRLSLSDINGLLTNLREWVVDPEELVSEIYDHYGIDLPHARFDDDANVMFDIAQMHGPHKIKPITIKYKVNDSDWWLFGEINVENRYFYLCPEVLKQLSIQALVEFLDALNNTYDGDTALGWIYNHMISTFRQYNKQLLDFQVINVGSGSACKYNITYREKVNWPWLDFCVLDCDNKSVCVHPEAPLIYPNELPYLIEAVQKVRTANTNKRVGLFIREFIKHLKAEFTKNESLAKAVKETDSPPQVTMMDSEIYWIEEVTTGPRSQQYKKIRYLKKGGVGTGRLDGPTIVYVKGEKAGTEYWLKDGNIHRDNGPAILRPDGRMEYWQDGTRQPKDQFFNNLKLQHIESSGDENLTRACSLGPDGQSIVYHNADNRFHRNGAPAHILANGDELWFQNGVAHRLDGPACIRGMGTIHAWYKEGSLHRTDGPASYGKGLNSVYFLDGVRLDEAAWLAQVSNNPVYEFEVYRNPSFGNLIIKIRRKGIDVSWQELATANHDITFMDFDSSLLTKLTIQDLGRLQSVLTERLSRLQMEQVYENLFPAIKQCC